MRAAVWFDAMGGEQRRTRGGPRSQADAVEASEKNYPYCCCTASYCHYCATVKADVYFPMNDDPDARARVVLREIQVDSSAPIREFSGSQLNHREFAKIRGITIVPTLEIVDEQGRAAHRAFGWIGR